MVTLRERAIERRALSQLRFHPYLAAIPCGLALARRGTYRSCHPRSSRDRHRLDRFGGCLLARSDSALRHADLQRAGNGISRLPRHPRQMGWASLVAGRCRPPDPDDASRPGVAQRTKEDRGEDVKGNLPLVNRAGCLVWSGPLIHGRRSNAPGMSTGANGANGVEKQTLCSLLLNLVQRTAPTTRNTSSASGAKSSPSASKL